MRLLALTLLLLVIGPAQVWAPAYRPGPSSLKPACVFTEDYSASDKIALVNAKQACIDRLIRERRVAWLVMTTRDGLVIYQPYEIPEAD